MNIVKKIDTREYVRVLEELLQQNINVCIPISGNSMAPFLVSGRDQVLLQRPNRELKTGDIVFYKRVSGEYILHRIVRINNKGVYIVGDASTTIEGPISKCQIFGMVTNIQRKGKWIDKANIWWLFFEYIWIRIIPFRPTLVSIYSFCKHYISFFKN